VGERNGTRARAGVPREGARERTESRDNAEARARCEASRGEQQRASEATKLRHEARYRSDPARGKSARPWLLIKIDEPEKKKKNC
jgi:hypothetical protein